MIADDKKRILIHFEQSKVLIFQKFPKNFSTEVVKLTTLHPNQLSSHVEYFKVCFHKKWAYLL